VSISDPNPAVTRPLEDELEPVAGDDPDTVALTRPLPDIDVGEAPKQRPELMPSIGHIGRYALKYKIGEGGLGTVYAAHDPLLSRLIAIKTLNVDLPEQDREQFNALFLNEAKAAGSLNHPHIVTMYDAGTSAQGTYIAMEMLRGKDLRQLLAQGWRPTPAQAALIVRRVADALSYAHHKGVIHRDIKPANIFMVGRTQPRVLDFGIARIRQAETLNRDDEQSRFQEMVGGSPYYMAPEQAQCLPVDRRADVYSLGVVLYELLTGRRPFSGNSLEDIADAVLRGEVPPAHEVNPDVPKALSEIAAQAMARDVEQRTRSARVLSKALREWLVEQDELALANGDGAFGGRRAWLMPALLVGGVLAMLVGGVVAWQSRSGAEAQLAGTSPAPSVPNVVAPVAPSAPPAVLATTTPPASSSAISAVVTPVVASSVAAADAASVADTHSAVPATGVVRLAITPWGEVFEGKRSLGVTPPMSQLTLPEGRHTLTIRNGDAPPWHKTVEVKAGKAVRVEHHF